jgi:hypothetical protein
MPPAQTSVPSAQTGGVAARGATAQAAAAKASTALPWVLLLDLAVVVTNFFLVGFLARETGALMAAARAGEDSRAALFLGLVLLATFLAQIVGAYLKRAPMHARLAAGRAAEQELLARKWPLLKARGGSARQHRGLVNLLCVLHYALSLAVVIYATVLLGPIYFPEGALAIGLLLFAFYIALPLISTALTVSALDPPKRVRPRLAHPSVEILANACLFSYALVNQLFWTALTADVSAAPGPGEIPGRLLASYAFIVPATLMYYFSPRILFLAEELGDRRTRLSMALAVVSIAVRWVIGSSEGRGLWIV